MAEDITIKVVETKNCTYFYQQLDESKCTQFVAFVKYNKKNGISNDI